LDDRIGTSHVRRRANADTKVQWTIALQPSILCNGRRSDGQGRYETDGARHMGLPRSERLIASGMDLSRMEERMTKSIALATVKLGVVASVLALALAATSGGTASSQAATAPAGMLG
jgi:hypothetical protein